MNSHRYRPPIALDRYRVGPLSPYIQALASRLFEAEYARETERRQIRVVADLSRWLRRHRTAPSHLNERVLGQFLKRRRRYDVTLQGDAAAVGKMLELLREMSIAPAARTRKDSGHPIAQDFERYLIQERRLAPVSLLNVMPFIRLFLAGRFGAGRAALIGLRSADVTAFILRRARKLGSKRAQIMVWALRSFFRFLHLRGQTHTDLTGAVPTIPTRRWSNLPKFIEADKVRRLIRSCDRRTVAVRRDYAILLLLARLGLRAGEAVALNLEDIDWLAGEICILGKGSRQDRLPLSDDVGRALVAYLRRAGQGAQRGAFSSPRGLLLLVSPTGGAWDAS